jgi:hypothetical protein
MFLSQDSVDVSQFRTGPLTELNLFTEEVALQWLFGILWKDIAPHRLCETCRGEQIVR